MLPSRLHKVDKNFSLSYQSYHFFGFVFFFSFFPHNIFPPLINRLNGLILRLLTSEKNLYVRVCVLRVDRTFY